LTFDGGDDDGLDGVVVVDEVGANSGEGMKHRPAQLWYMNGSGDETLEGCIKNSGGGGGIWEMMVAL